MITNTTFTNADVSFAVNSFTSHHINFQEYFESIARPHLRPYIILGGDMPGLCPFGSGHSKRLSRSVQWVWHSQLANFMCCVKCSHGFPPWNSHRSSPQAANPYSINASAMNIISFSATVGQRLASPDFLCHRRHFLWSLVTSAY